MHLGSGGEKGVHGVDRPALSLAAGDNLPPRIGNRSVDREHTLFEAQRQLLAQPHIQPRAAAPSGHPFDAMA